ncbi:MAG TPA: acyltransferase [Acetobacteraceae bacterium]|jgi:peptidoglycan/LPS O-acetylase OafA/YrhL|nr:acyltransferase [Acetobacteraceae bacterium]
MSPQRNPALDAVRGVAISCVVLAHCFPNSFPRGGLVGVDLFFVLSGFLIGGNLMDRKGQPGYFADFYRRRAFRILPLYLLLLVVTPLALSQPLWHYLTFTQNFWWAWSGNDLTGWDAPTWSLAVEEQFYAVAPFLVALVPLARLPPVLIGLAALAPLCRAIASNATATYVLMPCRMDALFAGMLVAWIVRFWRPRPGVVLAAVLVTGAGFVCTVGNAATRSSIQLWGAGYTMEAAFFASMLLALVMQGWRGNPVLGWLGVRAYGLYLTHTLMMVWTGNNIIGVGASLVVSAIAWRYLEEPLIRFGKKPFDLFARPAGLAS